MVQAQSTELQIQQGLGWWPSGLPDTAGTRVALRPAFLLFSFLEAGSRTSNKQNRAPECLSGGDTQHSHEWVGRMTHRGAVECSFK